MSNLIIHKTPREFLDSNYDYLAKNEIENNLILGLCLKLADANSGFENCNFLSVKDINNNIEAVSFRNTPRIIVWGEPGKETAITLLASHYRNLNLKIGGVFGKKDISEKFAAVTGLKQKKKRIMIVHELEKTSDPAISKGRFENSKIEDIEQLFQYRIAFDNEAFGYSRMDYDELRSDTESKIRKGLIYSWIYNNEIVSIAAIVRTTKNTGIVGLVYTPKEFRGNGYATSIVLSLSKEILSRGFSKCGLFTDKSNPESNHIYYKIGYRPNAEFADIYFENF